MFTCGFVRSNRSFAILLLSPSLHSDNELVSAGSRNQFAGTLNHFLVVRELHRIRAASLGAGTQSAYVTKHRCKWHLGLDDLGPKPRLNIVNTPAPRIKRT